MTTDWLHERDAAALLGLSPHTLARWRWAGQGPKYAKFGKAVRYSRADLAAYAADATRASTSDGGKVAA